jgi:hypothetical protein
MTASAADRVMVSMRISVLGMTCVYMALAGIGSMSRADDVTGGSRAWTRLTRLDSLFLIAATGEPRFQSARDSSEKTLLALGDETLNYLIAAQNQTGRERTPRQRQYVERLFTVMADSGRNPLPRRALARALAGSINDTVRAQWLYIGSRMADTAFRPAAMPYLGSSFEGVRRMAVRTLGAYPQPENLPHLWAGLDTLRGLELHQRLWALETHSPLSDWKRLIPLLSDADHFNRQKAREMLLRASDSNWVTLAGAMPKNPGRSVHREWRLLALEAKAGTGGREYLLSERAKMTKEERVFFGVH